MLLIIRKFLLKKNKIFILLFIISAVVIFYVSGAHEQLTLENIQKNLDIIRSFYSERPLLTIAIFLAIYIGITALSIPGAIVLTLLSGAIFGVLPGTFLVSLACTAGATIAFLMSRYLFQASLTKKYEKKLRKINEKMKVNGNKYLITMRVIPVSPFVVINVVMGLTSIKTWSFVWITFIAMFPGNLIYVYAGRRISEIQSASEILTWPIILLLTFLGVLPLIFKKSKDSSGDQYEPGHGQRLDSSR